MIATLTKAQWRILSELAAGETIDSDNGRAPFMLHYESRGILPSTFRILRRRGYLRVKKPKWYYGISGLGVKRFYSGEVAVL